MSTGYNIINCNDISVSPWPSHHLSPQMTQKEHLDPYMAKNAWTATGFCRATSPINPPNQEAIVTQMQLSEPKGTPSDSTYIYNITSAYYRSWLSHDNTLKMWWFSYIQIQGESLTKCKHNSHLLQNVHSNLQKKDQHKQKSVGLNVNTTAQYPGPSPAARDLSLDCLWPPFGCTFFKDAFFHM